MNVSGYPSILLQHRMYYCTFTVVTTCRVQFRQDLVDSEEPKQKFDLILFVIVKPFAHLDVNFQKQPHTIQHKASSPLGGSAVPLAFMLQNIQ